MIQKFWCWMALKRFQMTASWKRDTNIHTGLHRCIQIPFQPWGLCFLPDNEFLTEVHKYMYSRMEGWLKFRFLRQYLLSRFGHFNGPYHLWSWSHCLDCYPYIPALLWILTFNRLTNSHYYLDLVATLTTFTPNFLLPCNQWWSFQFWDPSYL